MDNPENCCHLQKLEIPKKKLEIPKKKRTLYNKVSYVFEAITSPTSINSFKFAVQ